jgi:LPXTG-motif cell wall-anchored protein
MMNKNKIKKLIALLTVICFMFGFASIPVSASDYNKVGGHYIVLSPGDSWVTNGGNLFGDIPVLYPGESAEFSIEVQNPLNDATRITTVTMYIEKLFQVEIDGKIVDTDNDLANYILLTITDVTNNEPVYVGMLSNLGVRIRTISFPVTANTILKFNAEFIGLNRYQSIDGLGTDPDGWQNSLMSLTAAFLVRFDVSVRNISITPQTPTPAPTTTGAAQPQTTTAPEYVIVVNPTIPLVDLTTAGPAAAPTTQPTTIPVPPAEPTTQPPIEPTTLPPIVTTAEPTSEEPASEPTTATQPTSEPTPTTEPPIEPASELTTSEEPATAEPTTTASTQNPTPQPPTTTEEEEFEPPIMTIPLATFPDDPTGPSHSEYASEGVSVKDEYFDDITNPKIPQGTGDFDHLDKMPQTGEKTNPMLNLTAGLALALIGGVTIIGVTKKKKDDEENDDVEKPS